MLFDPRCVAAFLLASTNIAAAAPITIDANGNPWEVFHFREVSGPTGVFGSPNGPSDTLGFGITDVVPNGKGEDDGTVVSSDNTTVVARQNGVEINIGFAPDSFEPNRFATGVNFDPNLVGSWELTVSSGTDSVVVQTPTIDATLPPERATNVRLTQGDDPTAPLIEWNNNTDNADRITITIFDLTRRSAITGTADRVIIEGMEADANSYQVPTGALDPDGLYSVRISTAINRKTSDGTAGVNPSGSSQQGAALVRGSTYFDFSTEELSKNQVFIPEVSFGEDDSPIFNFNNPVLAEQVEFYDPIVAVGYDYLIGDNNPFFNSFILPEIGDDLFDLYLWDGTNFIFESVVGALDEFKFDTGGVDRFRVLGIETGAALDPSDPTAFVTGLSFVSDGQFTGSMTPISVFVDDPSPVPLPASLPMLGCAIFGIIALRRKKALAI